jgi:ribosomal-protein-alanine N-acetyltransferase
MEGGGGIMTARPLVITAHDVATDTLIEGCMTVMVKAFDPAFGEAWSAQQMRSMMDLPGTILIAGRLGDDIVGFGLQRTIVGETELLLLAVVPEHRRAGFGHRILDRCIAQAEHDGSAMMFLEVREDNPAQTFYQVVGFSQYSTRRDYYTGLDGLRRSALSLRRAIVSI